MHPPARRIAILGSTGSIGQSTLDVVRHSRGQFSVVALTANRSCYELCQQAAEFAPRFVVVTDDEQARTFDWSSLPRGTELLTGQCAVEKVVKLPDVDIVVAAVVGSAGLTGTWAALDAGKDVALANKETLVMAGPLVTRLAADRGAKILPVDSEHSAVFQLLNNIPRDRTCAAAPREGLISRSEMATVRRIILTASGGPFRDWTRSEMESATVADALAHPTWQMGKKITIDSATMMNKALEIIEARWLFDLPPSQIDVVIHPQSIVHSLVEFIDGSVLAQLSPPDMRLPIQVCPDLAGAHARSGAAARLDPGPASGIRAAGRGSVSSAATGSRSGGPGGHGWCSAQRRQRSCRGEFSGGRVVVCRNRSRLPVGVRESFLQPRTHARRTAQGRSLGAAGDFAVDMCLNAVPMFSLLAATGEPTWLTTFGSYAWMFLSVGAGLGFVIFVHELGHFLVAKACGVKCDKFYIGFDVPMPKIFGWQIPSKLAHFQWGETEYGIGILPLGGYVKMLGQDDDPRNAEAESDRTKIKSETGQVQLDPRSYPAKPVPARMAIISAGVIMNLIFAVILATIAYRFGVPEMPAVIGGTLPASPAWTTNIQPGDKVLQFGREGEPYDYLRWEDLMREVVLNGSDRDLDVLVQETDGRKTWHVIRPSDRLRSINDRPTLGVVPQRTREVVLPPEEAKYLGFKSDVPLEDRDEIVAVNGQRIESDYVLTQRLAMHYNQPLKVTIARAEKVEGPAAEANNTTPTKREIDAVIEPRPMRELGLVMKIGPVVAVRAGRRHSLPDFFPAIRSCLSTASRLAIHFRLASASCPTRISPHRSNSRSAALKAAGRSRKR